MRLLANRLARPLLQYAAIALAAGYLASFVFADSATDAADAEVLRSVGLPTDSTGLLEFLRRLTPNDQARATIDGHVQSLGDRSFRKRESASAALLAIGPPALPALQVAANSTDPEVRRRAGDLVRQVDRIATPGSLSAAIRQLAVTRPEGTVEALLAWAPAAPEQCVDTLREALTDLARIEAAPALVAALKDDAPTRRGLAAYSLALSQAVDRPALIRPLLKDTDARVRLEAALGLANAKDREAIPVLIDLLGELPAESAWRVEDLLTKLAADAGPTVGLGRDAAGRKACRDAWKDWWQGQGATVDLGRITAPGRWNNVTLLAAIEPRQNTSEVSELGADGKVQRSVSGLSMPMSIQPVSRDRVLIAEFSGTGRVTERDFSGRVYWEKQIASPVSCQRLPNGNTFIATRTGLFEFDAKGEQVWHVVNDRVYSAYRNRDGTTTVVTMPNPVVGIGNRNSRLVVLDGAGKEVRSYSVGKCLVGCSINALPGGRVMIPEYLENRVAEYDIDGKVVWSYATPSPRSAQRLPNGNTLVISSEQRGIIEVDRAGRPLKTMPIPTDTTPLFIVRH